MKVKVNRKLLLDALQRAKKVVPNMALLPVLANVLIKDGTICATDLELFVSSNVPELGEITALAPCAVLLGVIKKLSAEEVEIQVKENKMVVRAGGHKSTISLDPAVEDFPDWGIEGKEGSEIELTDDWYEGLKICASVSAPERFGLDGVAWTKDGLISSDAISLYNYAVDPVSEDVFIPSNLAKLLVGVGKPNTCFLSEKFISFSFDDVVVASRRVAYGFPNILEMVFGNAAIPHGFEVTDELRQAAQRIDAFSKLSPSNLLEKQVGEPVLMDATEPNEIRLKYEAGNNIEEVVEINHGMKFSVKINSIALTKALHNADKMGYMQHDGKSMLCFKRGNKQPRIVVVVEEC